MSFNDTLLECLKRLQKEILLSSRELPDEMLMDIFYGKNLTNTNTELESENKTKEESSSPNPKKVKIKKKKKKTETKSLEIEVEPWRLNKYGKLYLKCINTDLLYDPVTEECIGKYIYNFDNETETIHLYSQ